MRHLNYFLILIFISYTITGVGQDQPAAKADSAIIEANKKLVEENLQIQLSRKKDSIERASLESQLLDLGDKERSKKDELLNQLLTLNKQDSIRTAHKKMAIDSLRANAPAYVIQGFFKDTLFLIRSKIGSFSPELRASIIEKKIKNLAKSFDYNPDSLIIAAGENAQDLIYRDEIIMSITENDALWENSSKLELAEKNKAIINTAILKYKKETNWKTLSKEIGLALLVLFIIIFLLKYIGKLYTWLTDRVKLLKGTVLNGIKIRNYTLFNADQEVNAAVTVLNVLKWLSYILTVYLALPILFGIFPWTKDLADVLIGYIMSPIRKVALGLWNYMPNLVTIIVIVFIFRYVLRGIYFLKIEIQRGNLKIPGFYADWANPTYQIVKVLVFAFMVIVIFPYLPGSDSPIFQGVSVFLGFLFTFGSAGSLSNIVAGLILTYMRLFRIGDRVKIGEVTGDVIEKSLLVTRIRTIKNEIISIPNSTVMNSHTVNYSSDATENGLIIHTTVTIGYDVPWRDMHDTLIAAALKTNLVLKEPQPFVLQTSLDDFYVSYQINAYIRESNKQAIIYSELHQHIQDECNERGIEILSPHYRAARDGNQSTIPASYLPADYEKPSFSITSNKG